MRLSGLVKLAATRVWRPEMVWIDARPVGASVCQRYGSRRQTPPAAGSLRLDDLATGQCGEEAASPHQIVVAAALDDPAPIHHEDPVHVANRAEPVGNDDAGRTQLPDGRLHGGLGLGCRERSSLRPTAECGAGGRGRARSADAASAPRTAPSHGSSPRSASASAWPECPLRAPRRSLPPKRPRRRAATCPQCSRRCFRPRAGRSAVPRPCSVEPRPGPVPRGRGRPGTRSPRPVARSRAAAGRGWIFHTPTVPRTLRTLPGRARTAAARSPACCGAAAGPAGPPRVAAGRTGYRSDRRRSRPRSRVRGSRPRSRPPRRGDRGAPLHGGDAPERGERAAPHEPGALIVWITTLGGHRLGVGFRPLPQTTRSRSPRRAPRRCPSRRSAPSPDPRPDRRRPREARGDGCPRARGARRQSSVPPAGAAA